MTLVLEHSKMNETANEDKRCGSFLLLRCGDVTTSSDWRQVGGAGGQWRMVTSQGGWPRPATGRVETFYLADSQSIVRWHIIHVMNPLRESLSSSRGTQFNRYVAVKDHQLSWGGGCSCQYEDATEEQVLVVL